MEEKRRWARRTGIPLDEFHALARERRIFRARDIEALGWSRNWLRFYVGLNWLKQHGRGRYGLPQIFGPAWSIHVEAALRFPGHVFCLTSALWIFDVLKDEPGEAWMLLGKSAHLPVVTDVPIHFARMRAPPPAEELRSGSLDGVPMRVCSLERALVDCLRLPGLVRPQLAQRALQTALLQGKTTPEHLNTMAGRLRAAGRLRRALDSVAHASLRTAGPTPAVSQPPAP